MHLKSQPNLHYREMSMREDYRVDLKGAGPNVTKYPDRHLMRENSVINEIVGKTMNPRGPHSLGNFGRWNFAGGSLGPAAPPSPPVMSEGGAVISLPGAGDQATHADCEHLFDHVDLPGHYYNLFACAVSEEGVGQTCFIAGTHKLETCQRVTREDGGSGEVRAEFEELLCRPRLEIGDALIFDARVLHFGAGNASKATRRPLLYLNYWRHFYEDRKNWGGESLFQKGDEISRKETVNACGREGS